MKPPRVLEGRLAALEAARPPGEVDVLRYLTDVELDELEQLVMRRVTGAGTAEDLAREAAILQAAADRGAAGEPRWVDSAVGKVFSEAERRAYWDLFATARERGGAIDDEGLRREARRLAGERIAGAPATPPGPDRDDG